MSFVASGDTGITAINTVLAEEANRIGQDIYKQTVHTSPWIDLVKQSAFPDGMGYQLTTLVYDRAIPTTGSAGNTAGVNWHEIGIVEGSNGAGESYGGQCAQGGGDERGENADEEAAKWRSAWQADDPLGSNTFVGEVTGLIDDVRPASDILTNMVEEAETLLKKANSYTF